MISDAALSSPDDSMQGPDLVGDLEQGSNLACHLEQLEDSARPTTQDYPLQGTDLAGDLEQLEDPVRPTTLDYPLQGTDLAGDLEQPKDPNRPMTPGEEKIMRIY